MIRDIKIFSGTSNPKLAESIAEHVNLPLGKILVDRFSDGEIRVKFEENIRGEDVFLIQSTQPPSDNLMELLIMVDAARRASAARITAVIPYFGYARQDRKDRPRVAITAKLVANLITHAGVDRVLTMDLHAAQIQGFFDIPLDHLYASAVFTEHFRQKEIPNLCVVAPDVGSITLARAYSKRLNASLAMVDKRRPRPNVSEVMNVIGSVKEKNVVLFDDLIDTGGTITSAANILREKGAKEVYAACTHPILSGNAIEKIEKSVLTKLTVTDSVPGKLVHEKIEVLSCAKVFSDAIKRIHNEESISSLFVY
jgi:ribose-phosphate pyrophosphokinase